MLTRFRALVAVSMLAGFYVVTTAAVVALAVVARLLGRPWGGFFALAALGLASTMVVALVRIARLPRFDRTGVEVTAGNAPQLLELVRQLAKQVDTRPPDRVVFVAMANAAVSEHPRWLGLRGGQRTLVIGLPLVQNLTVAQLRAVIAHELGHYWRGHTRLGPVVYRGTVTMASVIEHVGPQSVLGRLLIGYARLFLLFSFRARRQQEIEADSIAARVAGASALSSALGALPGIGALWSRYLSHYVGEVWWNRHAPDRIIGAFPELVAAASEELADPESAPSRLLAAAAESRSRWDSHPPIADRVSYLSTLADTPTTAEGERPATELVLDFEALASELDDAVFQRHGHALVPWQRYTPLAAEAECSRDSKAILTRFAKVTMADATTPEALLDAVGTPEFERFVTLCDLEGPALLATVVADCVVRSGVAKWTHSWRRGPAILVQPGGAELDVRDIALRLVDPGAAAAARDELAKLGVKLDNATVVQRRRTPPRVLGLIINVVADGKRRDLIVYDQGIAVVPGSKRTKMQAAESRLVTMARQQRLAEIVAAPGARYLPFDDVARCERVRATWLGRILTLLGGLKFLTGGRVFAMKLTMHDGSEAQLRWGMETTYVENSHEVLEHCIDLLTGQER